MRFILFDSLYLNCKKFVCLAFCMCKEEWQNCKTIQYLMLPQCEAPKFGLPKRLDCYCAYLNQKVFFLTTVKSLVLCYFKKLNFISKSTLDMTYLRLLLNCTLFAFFTVAIKMASCLSVCSVPFSLQH